MGKMRVVKKLVVSVNEYTNRDGDTKKEWRNVGIMMQDEDDPERIVLKFDMQLPMTPNVKGYAECWVKAFELRENNQTSSDAPPTRSESSSPPPSSNHDDDSAAPSTEDDDAIDDIPF